ncbi:MAG: hypothetical protein M3Q49_02195 [Actinomycetota bacterium]|nr:hypothetical protein [Actinomycetota bacterium]MDP9484599.1 hypothetical protein [Actinomycetota bacterium]
MAERLPNAEEAYTDEAKVAGYLLDPEHPRNEGKAEFFFRHGFSREAWEVLMQALLRHAREGELAETQDGPYGAKHVVEGALASPDGRDPRMRSVWIVDFGTGSLAPRLVTAYPQRRGGRTE